MNQIFSYLKFWWKSKNQHGIHSPFVYNLITQCFYDQSSYNSYSKLKQYRRDLLNNPNAIEVTDLGAGSHVINRKMRTISQIAKHAGTTHHRAKLLFRLVHYFKCNTILELGTSLGIATYAMHLGHSNSNITTIEGCPNLSKFSEDGFKRLKLSNITVLTGDFKNVLQTLTSNRYDFIFIDGNHQKEATLDYFKTLLPTVHNDSVFIFDDIHWSKGMTEAWETILQHPKVTVSIDTFFWGFVFFRKEQVKEHFTIRV